ncbi:hypothetical protein [Burkholderia sp. Bp8984]|uniref:hypothetical protein n=1 Tax=Burkholderia sp. Bp8984 TaxID=2184549 RepID=UPI0016239723|nr:hypothetical protein [Burkholderia sp. Bp8984]
MPVPPAARRPIARIARIAHGIVIAAALTALTALTAFAAFAAFAAFTAPDDHRPDPAHLSSRFSRRAITSTTSFASPA